MKHWVVSGLLFFVAVTAHAQPIAHRSFLPVTPANYSYRQGPEFTDEAAVLKWLQSRFLKHEGEELTREYTKTSPAGTHIRFRHIYKGLPVYRSTLQVNVDQQGKVYLVTDALAKFEKEIPTAAGEKDKLWINTDLGLVKGYESTRVIGETNREIKQVFSADDQWILDYSSRLYFQGPDSMVTGMVYLPNPLVATNNVYGGKFIDNNDKNSVELTNARSKVRLRLRFLNGKFLMQQGFIVIKNLSDPPIQPVVVTDTFLNFTRDLPGFEDVNVMFHLSNYSNYLRRIGFKKLLDTIYVDTHMNDGEDNSFFEPDKTPFQLQYGNVFVDDAEDGQVVLHEFGHSLSVIAAPNSTLGGTERLSMEEGQADYIAMSYSASLSKNRQKDVFSWDGHNEFWDGFVCNTPRTYKDLKGDTDFDRELWSTALMCIHDKLGRSIADSLILSYYFHQTNGSRMPEMAQVILKMDTLLFKGKHVARVWQCFTDREILDTVPFNLIGIDPLHPASDIAFYNTEGFATGVAAARIVFNYPDLWRSAEVYNHLGQKVASVGIQKEVAIEPGGFASGMYYVKITSTDGRYAVTQKLMRM